MSGRIKQPLHRQIRIVLDGSQSRFETQLNSYMRETSQVVLLGYHVLNTPVTATIPDTPILSLEFEQSGGFELTPQISNLPVQNAIVLPLSGAVTSRDCSTGIVLGELRGGRAHTLLLRVRDVTGAEHNASSNKLFDWLTLELMVLEAGKDLQPEWLTKVPSIQAVMDTV